jgi:DnaA family protein
MEQLVFELAAPESPSFANFLPGRNAEVLDVLRQVAAGDIAETGLLLWGATGVGKTHLLRAVVAATLARGGDATLIAEPGMLGACDPDALAALALVAIDGIDDAGTEAQARAFTLFNGLRARGGHLVVASGVPPAALTMREDLRTRLGWGLVYEVVALADAEKPVALAAYARQRGLRLPAEVIDFLLVHGRRDMPWLIAALAALDRHTLATKRPLTVPLLRDWLQRQLRLEG